MGERRGQSGRWGMKERFWDGREGEIMHGGDGDDVCRR